MQSVIIIQNSATVPSGFYVPVNNVPTTIDRYRQRESIGFGIVQIVVGVTCIFLNIGTLFSWGYGRFFHGVWSGALFIVTGSQGIAAGKYKIKCKIVAYMVLCIISSSFAVALLSIGIIATRPVSCTYKSCYSNSAEPALEACLAALAIVEGIFSILGAVLCCMAGICCCRNRTEPAFLQTNYLPNTDQIMYFPSNLQLQVPHPPTAPYNQQERRAANPPPYSATIAYHQTRVRQTRPRFNSNTAAPISPTNNLPLNPPPYSIV